MKFFFYAVLLSYMFWSCNSKVEKSKDNLSDSISVKLNSYWAEYKFNSNEVRDSPDRIEQSLVDYIAQFSNYSISDVKQSLQFLIGHTENDSIFFAFIRNKLTDYLNHPNSPLRNDYYYEEVLKVYQASSLLSDVDKLKDKLVLDLVSKNQVGAKAANFQFEKTDGSADEFESYQSVFKLLVFYDPTCSHCHEVIHEMKNSALLDRLITEDRLVVLAIDPVANRKDWMGYQKEIPSAWINGIDASQSILTKSLYNIQAYPTIYLIDSDGFVVLKDVYFPYVEKYLLNF